MSSKFTSSPQRVLPEGNVVDTTTFGVTPGIQKTTLPLLCDNNGVLLVSFAAVSPGPGPILVQANVIENNADAEPATLNGFVTASFLYGFNGASWDRVRVANVFKTQTSNTAAAATVWTPAAGKKFRLMGYEISIAGTLAATGIQAITLLDGATTIKNHITALIQTTTASIALITPVFDSDMGQGYLSAAANNVLTMTMTNNLATGNCSINAWGTEE
jgi:hypothetical protein